MPCTGCWFICAKQALRRSISCEKKMNEQQSSLQVSDLYKIFSSNSIFFWQKKEPFVAVDHISFELHKGEILGLLGPNGAGKTTTIQMLLGTMLPTSGTITYFGKNFNLHRGEVMNRITFASTYVRLPGRLSLYENIDFYAKLYNVPYNERHVRIEHYLKFFDLWNIKDRKASALSAGETTRAILAKAFIPHPDVVLLDEPTASLDPDIAYEVRKFVLEQRRERNISILFTSHNMDDVTAVCDRVLVMKRGVIIADDTPQKLASRVANARVKLLASVDLERIKQFATEQGYHWQADQNTITIEIDEHRIAQLLTSLTKHDLRYDHVTIDQPTLEDYFLSITKRKDRGAL